MIQSFDFVLLSSSTMPFSFPPYIPWRGADQGSENGYTAEGVDDKNEELNEALEHQELRYLVPLFPTQGNIRTADYKERYPCWSQYSYPVTQGPVFEKNNGMCHCHVALHTDEALEERVAKCHEAEENAPHVHRGLTEENDA